MRKIPIVNIVEVTDEMLLYRDEYGEILQIELEPCAKRYEETHPRVGSDTQVVRCVGERFFGAYAYYELYTDEHTQLFMNLKTNRLQELIFRVIEWNFHAKEFQRFYAIQKQLNAHGWTTLDLS